jgi:hypothetical protein
VVSVDAAVRIELHQYGAVVTQRHVIDRPDPDTGDTHAVAGFQPRCVLEHGRVAGRRASAEFGEHGQQSSGEQHHHHCEYAELQYRAS